MELAEVQSAHPGIECLRFHKDDPEAILDLLGILRERFGKAVISEEDRIRSQSIRNTAVLVSGKGGDKASYEQVLRNSEATISFRRGDRHSTGRAFELVNKTNQFNLNGRRYSEAAWKNYLEQSCALLLTVSYKDKFGPLGEIAVIMGRILPDDLLHVDTWVM